MCNWSHKQTGTTFYTQPTQLNINEEIGHIVDESQSDSKMKWTATTSGRLQDFVDTINRQPSKWEYLIV